MYLDNDNSVIKMKSTITLFIVTISCAFIPSVMKAQNNFDTFKKQMDSSFDNYRKSKENEFENFRRKINKEYAEMLEKAWKEFNAIAKIRVPEDKIKPVPPVTYPKRDIDNKPKTDPKPIPFDNVVPVPNPTPQPQPVTPIEDTPKPVNPIISKITFSFFGTQGEVRFDDSMRKILTDVDERNVSRAWKEMSTDNYTQLIYDCLQIRKQKNLCDWAYLEMLHTLSEKIYGKGANSATLLMAYIYCQSGYKMRLGRDNNRKLYMLYASDHLIYDINYYTLNGVRFYPYGAQTNQIFISDISFPNESTMSLLVSQEQKLSVKESTVKVRQSQRYPEVRTSMATNLNLINFYNSYPTSMIGENLVSRWALYANTPMSDGVKQQIYPSLKKAINGCSQLTAVNKILNYVQTGFTYEYDDKVWGHDRAFFAEESLYYPYCDCEDRSILFTRLVRDLLGLKCILIYYPGHLASAVEFTKDNVVGDYISLNNRKFIIADPTYIGAPVGETMPKMDNKTAKVILLE